MHSRGFSLIEIILALALTSLVVVGIANGLLLTDRVLSRLSDDVTALMLADECISVMRWQRDAFGLAALREGSYGLDEDGGAWQLTAEPDVTDGHTREVFVNDASEFEKNVECIVTWLQDGQPASASAVSRISL